MARTMKASLKQRLQSKLLEYLGLSWITLHDSVKRDLELLPSLIGSSASANALAYYVLHYEELSIDAQLAEFMRFYAANHMKSMSQWSQDIWVMYESRNSINKRYLEIGGADGYTHSNTLSLETYCDWSGTLVEPELHQFKILKISRKNNKLLNRALSPAGIFENKILRKVGQLSSLKGFESQDVHYDHRISSRRFQRVKAIPLQSILANTDYQYFSFDIEGAELPVLKSVDWSRVYKPKLLTIEHNNRDNEKKELTAFFKNIGYESSFDDHTWLLQGDAWLKLVA